MHPIRAMGGFFPGFSFFVPAGNFEHIVVSPTNATCNISFNSDGTISLSAGVNPPSAANWRSPTLAGVGSSYWIRWTNTSGTLSTGTAGSFLSLSGGQTFGVSRSGVGIKSCTGTVEISSDSGGSVIVASGSITLNAEVD